jgi:hypothetical protein
MLEPTPEEDLYVGIGMDGMGIGTLSRLTNGKEDIVSVPWIKGPIEKCIDEVCPMVLREGDVDIIRILPVPLVDGLDDSATLDDTLGPNMV